MTVEDATSFTLFGTVVTGEQVGVVAEHTLMQQTNSSPAVLRRVPLTLVGTHGPKEEP